MAMLDLRLRFDLAWSKKQSRLEDRQELQGDSPLQRTLRDLGEVRRNKNDYRSVCEQRSGKNHPGSRNIKKQKKN